MTAWWPREPEAVFLNRDAVPVVTSFMVLGPVCAMSFTNA